MTTSTLSFSRLSFRTLRTLLASIGLLFFVGMTVQAQVPQTMSYQGFLTAASGGALDGTHTLTFRLYDQSTGGTALWTETQSVEVTEGLFSALLGETTPLTLPFDEAYWLGVSIGSDAELSPRVPLTAVPYSLDPSSPSGTLPPGTDLTVRAPDGTAVHQLRADGSARHSGPSTFESGLEVQTGDVKITGLEEDQSGSTQVLVWDQDEYLRWRSVQDLSGPFTGGDNDWIEDATADEVWTGRSIALGSGGSGGFRVNSAAPAGTPRLRAGTNDGIGVQGQTANGWGVRGEAANAGVGVEGRSEKSDGVRGTSTDGKGVLGTSTNNVGVQGTSDKSVGVVGTSTEQAGVEGTSAQQDGVVGLSTQKDGVVGTTDAQGQAGVRGSADNSVGVRGTSANDDGVRGTSEKKAGVHGSTPAQGQPGVLGEAPDGFGVRGESNTHYGVYGTTNQALKAGVWGDSEKGDGVLGTSVDRNGVSGTSSKLYGVEGISIDRAGVRGFSESAFGVEGASQNGLGGQFFGELHIASQSINNSSFQSQLKIDQLDEDATQDRILVWSNDDYVRWRTLPGEDTETAFRVDAAAGTATTTHSLLIENDQGEIVTRLNNDGTSLHTNLETYTGGIAIDGGPGLFVLDDTGEPVVTISGEIPGNIHARGTLRSGNSIVVDGVNHKIFSDDPLEVIVDGERAWRVEPTANGPNLIGGFMDNAVTTGVLGATVAGGGRAGGLNHVTDDYGTVGGGVSNRAGDDAGNTDNAAFATVGGGEFNLATANAATISGGDNNEATAIQATISGGGSNVASGIASAIAGGTNNTAQGSRAVIGGGNGNSASGEWAAVGGGEGNQATQANATVGGGQENEALGLQSTVVGGQENVAQGQQSFVGGGLQNVALGEQTVIGGGSGNDANGANATIGGGTVNRADGPSAAIGGGSGNKAPGEYGTVPGGLANEAGGDFSFAAGQAAIVLPAHDGSFLWADTTPADFRSVAANEFAARATGGVRFVTAVSGGTPTAGVRLAAGGGSWLTLSDRHAKTDVDAVDPVAVLRRLRALPLSTWRYTTQSEVRHMGPMAQDFYAAFGLGEDERHINTVDADGVALAAVQGLDRVVQEKDRRIAELEAKVDRLSEQVEAHAQLLRALQARLDALENAGK